AEAELHEEDEIRMEVVPGVGEECGRDEVEERRPEVRAQLLAEQCDEAPHPRRYAPTRAGAGAATSWTKRSSRVGTLTCISRSVQPRATMVAASTCRAGSRS